MGRGPYPFKGELRQGYAVVSVARAFTGGLGTWVPTAEWGWKSRPQKEAGGLDTVSPSISEGWGSPAFWHSGRSKPGPHSCPKGRSCLSGDLPMGTEWAGVPGAGILHIECSTFHSIIYQDLE